MMPNMTYQIPTVGRIAIGEIIEANGKRLPRRLSHFRITAQHKRDGNWVEHPITAAVAKKMGVEPGKLTEIPIKLMVNDPDLIVRERYEAYTDKGRILCAGDGCKAKRMGRDGDIEAIDCPGPDKCEFGIRNRCDLMVRANVQIDVEDADRYTNDEMSTFILRSGGINTARTLNRKLKFMAGLFDGNLVGIPMILKLRAKSSAMSYQSTFYYVDIVLAQSLKESKKLANAEAKERQELGFNQGMFEKAIKDGLDNGPFEDTPEEFDEYEDIILGRHTSDEDKATAGEGLKIEGEPVADPGAQSMQALASYIKNLNAESENSAEPAAAA